MARASRLDGALPALLAALDDSGQLAATAWPEVEVVTGRVLVDVHNTARNPVATGIQRVARQAAAAMAAAPGRHFDRMERQAYGIPAALGARG